MPEFVDLESQVLEEAVESKKKVRLIFSTGYQTDADIEDFNVMVIIARVKGKRWMVYRTCLSTIVLD